MNWTGGRLSRHSGGGKAKAATIRQKAHYAKVQQGLRSGQKVISPIKWATFDRTVAEDGGRASQGQEFAGHSIERPPTRRIGSSSPPQPVHYKEGQHFTRKTVRRERSLSCEEEINDHDLAGHTNKKDETQMHKVTTTERRQKLLRNRDWAGIGILEPPKVKFNSPHLDANIGRRRKVRDGHKPRYVYRRQHVDSPFTHRNMVDVFQCPALQNSRPMADVRISIGGRVVPPGVSSSTRRSVASHGMSTALSIANYNASVSSDYMLLDGHFEMQSFNQVNKTVRGASNSSHPVGSTTYCGESPTAKFSKRQHERVMAERSLYHLLGARSASNNRPVFHSSSSVSIQQPVPEKSKPYPLVDCNSSEIAATNAAEVGERRQDFIESLRQQEEWGLRFDGGHNRIANLEDDLEGNRSSLTPGVSEDFGIMRQTREKLGDPKYQQSKEETPSISVMLEEEEEAEEGNFNSLDDAHGEDETLADNRESEEAVVGSDEQYGDLCWDEGSQLRRISIHESDIGVPNFLLCSKYVEEQAYPDLPGNEKRAATSVLITSSENNKTRPQSPTEKSIYLPGTQNKPAIDGADDIWRQFVFGSDDGNNRIPEHTLLSGASRGVEVGYEESTTVHHSESLSCHQQECDVEGWRSALQKSRDRTSDWRMHGHNFQVSSSTPNFSSG